MDQNMEQNSSAPVAANGEQGQSNVDRIKHPLENKWDFWLYTNKSQVWEKNLVCLTTFDTVEDYWCLYRHMKLPTQLEMGQDYMLFKHGIDPMWEHKANKKGGRWLIIPEKKHTSELDNIWLGVILLMIGENFKHSDTLCGAIVNVRVKSKIWQKVLEEATRWTDDLVIAGGQWMQVALDVFGGGLGSPVDDYWLLLTTYIGVWTRNTDEKANMEIAKTIKQQLRIHSKIIFYKHNSIAPVFSV